jgi:hypothetical protein
MKYLNRLLLAFNSVPILLLFFAAAVAPRPNPGLGAFSASVAVPVTSYTWSGTATFAPVGSESRRSLSGTGRVAPIGAPVTAFSAATAFPVTVSGRQYAWTGVATIGAGSTALRSISGVGDFAPIIGPGPGPPPPTVTAYQPNPATVGQTITITGSGFDATARATWQGLTLSTTFGSATSLSVVAPSVTQATSGAVTVTQASGSATGPALTVNPTQGPPPPPNVIDVTTRGVVNDGVTIVRTALNNLVQNAPAGSTLYFPAGTYLVDDAIKVYRNDLAFLGAGDTSIIKSVQGSYHFQIGHGGDITGIKFSRLQFYGTPGAYMSDGTSRGGVLNFGGKGVVFSDMLFRGCAEPVLDAGAVGGTYGTLIDHVRIWGHGRMAIFCNGGERITNCQIVQDDPNLFGERSSHGCYVHGGASDVLIADCEFANIRKYCIQAYSESGPSTTNNLQILRCVFRDSANGVITAHGDVNAGVLTNSLIEGNTFQRIYAGSSLAIKNGSGLVIRNNVIDTNTGSANGHTGFGLYLGWWAPYEQSFWLKDIQVTGNTVRNCEKGITTLPSNGGAFTNVQITGNNVSGNRKDYDITGPGVIWAPGRPPAAIKGGVPSDTRPSNDSSLAVK